MDYADAVFYIYIYICSFIISISKVALRVRVILNIFFSIKMLHVSVHHNYRLRYIYLDSEFQSYNTHITLSGIVSNVILRNILAGSTLDLSIT